ncbi:MAG: HAMP domain-containing protein [Spirochaetes bacterium]|nr:HAMP domain-containing protein [Spirochaetota bacterium]
MKKVRYQDFLIIISVFVLTSILVLGLYPKNEISGSELNVFFINTIMAMPLILAVYFIVISFRRKISIKNSKIDFSIQTKITLVLLLIALLPSLPVIVISNILVNRSLSSIVSLDTEKVFNRAMIISAEKITSFSEDIRSELLWYNYSVDNKLFNLEDESSRRFITEILNKKGYIFKIYKVGSISENGNAFENMTSDNGNINFSENIKNFCENAFLKPGISVSKISIENNSILTGLFLNDSYLSVIYRVIPSDVNDDLNMFRNTLQSYIQNKDYLPYLQSITGITLLIISVTVVFFSVLVSIFLAKGITRPITELIESAEKVGEGDLDVKIYRKARDEYAILYRTFNMMVFELREKRKVLMQMQKLQAWNEVGAKLLHEIKNPLTPIKLSAERIHRRFIEKNENLENIVLEGTETIIDEVNGLQHILDEFQQYARLPEPVLAEDDLKLLLENCIKLYKFDNNAVFELYSDPVLNPVKFDKQLMKQVFINIIKNAVEAIGDRDDGRIRITIFNSYNRISVSIWNNGPEITEEDKARLFEPNFSRKKDGTGLGLAIVERIILQHNGNIICTSSDQNGTEFLITI